MSGYDEYAGQYTGPSPNDRCFRAGCGHPAKAHRLDDARNISPADPAAPFRCVGPELTGCAVACPDFVRMPLVPVSRGDDDPTLAPPIHTWGCTQINGYCVNDHCGRCGKATGCQGCFECFPNRTGAVEGG